MNPREQKILLLSALKELYGDKAVGKEKIFEWGNVPDDYKNKIVYSTIYHKLEHSRGYGDFVKSKKIRYDFVINVPLNNGEYKTVIIEYDERQHFTELRRIALEAYPENIRLHFDKNAWIESCRTIHARDSDPVYRDEQRAFLDSIRDLSSAANNIPLIRLKYSDLDFTKISTEELKSYLKNIIDNAIN